MHEPLLVPAPRIRAAWIGDGWRLFRLQSGIWLTASLINLLVLIPVLILSDIEALNAMTAWARSFFPSSPALVLPTAGLGAGLLNFILNLTRGGVSEIMDGGLMWMALRQMRSETLRLDMVFAGFAKAGPLFGVGAFLSVIDLSWLETHGWASVALACYGLLPQALFLFAGAVVMDTGSGAGAALAQSAALVRRQWGRAVLLTGLLYLLALSGLLACGIGIIATWALYELALVVSYREFVPAPDAPVISSGDAQEGVWPPPPAVPAERRAEDEQE